MEEEAIRRFDVVRPRESGKESSVDSTGNGALDVNIINIVLVFKLNNLERKKERQKAREEKN